MVRADFPFTSRPFRPATLPLTINTSGGGSSDPFPIVDISTFGGRPNQLKKIEKVVIVFAAPVTLNTSPGAEIALSYFAANGTKILIRRLSSGTFTTLVITPPDTGPLLGAGEFPILEAEGIGFDDEIINLAEIHLGLDR